MLSITLHFRCHLSGQYLRVSSKETAMAMTIFMLLLIAIFTGIVLWVFGPGRKARFEKDARIPLDDDKSE